MKKQLLVLCAFLAIAHGANAMQKLANDITYYRNQIIQNNSALSEEEISQRLLLDLVRRKSNDLIEFLLKQGVKEKTGKAVEIALYLGFYTTAQLLLEYGAPITDKAWEIAKGWLEKHDDRFILLIHEYMQKEQIRKTSELLPKQNELGKLLQQLQFWQRK